MVMGVLRQRAAVAATLALGLCGCDVIFGDYLRGEERAVDAGEPVDADVGPRGPYLPPVSTELTEIAGANLLAVTDLDGDGRPEVVVSRLNISNALQTPNAPTSEPIRVYRISPTGAAVRATEDTTCSSHDRVQALQPFYDNKTGANYVAITVASAVRLLRHTSFGFDCNVGIITNMPYTDVAIGDMSNDQNDDVIYYSEIGCNGKCLRYHTRKGDAPTLEFNDPINVGLAYRTYQSRVVKSKVERKNAFFASAAGRSDSNFQINYISNFFDPFFNLFESQLKFPLYPAGFITANLDNSGYDDLVLFQSGVQLTGLHNLYVFEGKADPPNAGAQLQPKLGPYRPEAPSSQSYGLVRAANLDEQPGDELVMALSEPPLGGPGAGTIYVLRYTSLMSSATLQPLVQLDGEGTIPALEAAPLDPMMKGARPDLIYLRQRGASTFLTVRRANPGFAWQ